MKPRKIIIPIGPSLAYVPLTRGQHALIDSEEAERVGQHNWHAVWNPYTRSYYATRSVRGPGKKPAEIGLHRFVLELKPGLIADHVNSVTLDNRRSNLRSATASQNQFNKRMLRNNTTGFKGVFANGNKYVARIRVNRKLLNFGNHDTPELAHAAVCQARAELHGEFARIA